MPVVHIQIHRLGAWCKTVVTPVHYQWSYHSLVLSHWSWCHHQMETFSALLALCAGNSLVTSVFPSQRPVMWSFDIFFDLHLNKRLSKQSWGWWFEMPSRSLWHHCNYIYINTCLFPCCDKHLLTHTRPRVMARSRPPFWIFSFAAWKWVNMDGNWRNFDGNISSYVESELCLLMA